MKTQELIGPALDYAVLLATGMKFKQARSQLVNFKKSGHPFMPSTSWHHGGPIIEKEKIDLEFDGAEGGRWWATDAQEREDILVSGTTALIAAMRCFVAIKIGDEVQIPTEMQVN